MKSFTTFETIKQERNLSSAEQSDGCLLVSSFIERGESAGEHANREGRAFKDVARPSLRRFCEHSPSLAIFVLVWKLCNS